MVSLATNSEKRNPYRFLVVTIQKKAFESKEKFESVVYDKVMNEEVEVFAAKYDGEILELLFKYDEEGILNMVRLITSFGIFITGRK